MAIRQRAISNAQKETRRQQILDAGTRLYAQTDFESISMVKIAKETGVAKGTVYLYFKTKEALFLAILIEQFQSWFAEMDAGLTAVSPPISRQAFVDLAGDGLSKRPIFMRLIAILHPVLEQNIELETAVSFKNFLREHVLITGQNIETALPFLATGQGAQLLLQMYALLIGTQHQTNPTPIVLQAIDENPDLTLFLIEFKPFFKTTLNSLLIGIEQAK